VMIRLSPEGVDSIRFGYLIPPDACHALILSWATWLQFRWRPGIWETPKSLNWRLTDHSPVTQKRRVSTARWTAVGPNFPTAASIARSASRQPRSGAGHMGGGKGRGRY